MNILFINIGTVEVFVLWLLFLSVLFFVVWKLLKYLRKRG